MVDATAVKCTVARIFREEDHTVATEQDDKKQSAEEQEDESRNQAESDEDSGDGDEDQDNPSEGSDLGVLADGSEAVEGELVPTTPRNRAERRELAKKVKRGQASEEGEVKETDRNKKKVIVRPVVPPLTVTGKSTANTDEVPPWVKRTGDWLAAKRTTVFAAAAAVLIGSVGLVYTVRARADSRATQALKLIEAAQISNAEIRATDAPPEGPNRPPRITPTYADHMARARAALTASDNAINVAPDLATVPLARLSRAYVLYDLARYAEAKTVFESVLTSDLAGLNGRALEGLGFTLEALNDLPGALRRFDELARLEGDGWRELGTLHQARVLRRQGQSTRAKDMLHTLVERFDRARPDDTTTSANRAVNDQARALLHEIAPEDPLGQREAGGGTDTDSILRMLQQQMGGRVQMRRPGQPRGE